MDAKNDDVQNEFPIQWAGMIFRFHVNFLGVYVFCSLITSDSTFQ